MSTLIKNRIASIDLLKGLVMVIMALDHTRDYFHSAAYIYDPTDPNYTSWPIFLTRWITHYCAPTFSFLAGLSAFMVSRRKTNSELSKFLFTRGLWLVFIEISVVNFAWFFDVQFRTPSLITIWSLGISMIVLAGLIYLPRKIILIISCILIFGHNLLDPLHFKGSIIWAMLHDGGLFDLTHGYQMLIGYPVIPWIGVMALGYSFGSLYDSSFSTVRRKKILTVIGISAIVAFITIRAINMYGDPIGWKQFDTLSKSMMSFLNPLKYPPSLLYILMTLGTIVNIPCKGRKFKRKGREFFSAHSAGFPFFITYSIFISFICWHYLQQN